MLPEKFLYALIACEKETSAWSNYNELVAADPSLPTMDVIRNLVPAKYYDVDHYSKLYCISPEGRQYLRSVKFQRHSAIINFAGMIFAALAFLLSFAQFVMG